MGGSLVIKQAVLLCSHPLSPSIDLTFSWTDGTGATIDPNKPTVNLLPVAKGVPQGSIPGPVPITLEGSVGRNRNSKRRFTRSGFVLCLWCSLQKEGERAMSFLRLPYRFEIPLLI